MHVKTSSDVSSYLMAGSPPVAADTAHWVIFRLHASHYALPLAAVERVVRAAQVTPLSLVPTVILGAIDLEGIILPVFNLRQRFRLPDRPLHPDDQFLVARTASRTVVLAIDAAVGVVEQPLACIVPSSQIAPEMVHIRGVLPLQDGLVLIQDLEQLLSPEEGRMLDGAIDALDGQNAI
jgi:purine-binding chemotaxis protein CheW